MEILFIQIQCVTVTNNDGDTDVYMYGLTKQGRVWFKKDSDDEWEPESMRVIRNETQRTV